MSRTEIVNIVKKITQLSQRDKADLVRILEQALEGGGGGDTSKLISTEPQELTEEQQMQAKKNQGLYYSETVPEQTISWDGDTTGRNWFKYKQDAQFSIPGTFYKIADGPLDIRTQEIQILVNGNHETVSSGNWLDVNIADPGSVISGSLYTVAIDIRVGVDHYDTYYIYVCDNVVLNSEIFDFGGEMPFTGIFVSEGIESITVPEHEVNHKIDSKYIDDSKYTESIPSMILQYIYEGDVLVQKNIGYVRLAKSNEGSDNIFNAILRLSTGELVDGIEATLIASSDMDSEYHAFVDMPEGNGELLIVSGIYGGSDSSLIDTYLLTCHLFNLPNRKIAYVSFLLVIESYSNSD